MIQDFVVMFSRNILPSSSSG